MNTDTHTSGSTVKNHPIKNGIQIQCNMKGFLNTETHTRVPPINHLLEPTRSADLGKHSVDTPFPKDRNCEICQRTKITRAPCRRLIGGVVLRAENFGDFDYSRSQSSQRRL